MFKFSQRSLNNLKGVHPDLVRVCHAALKLTKVDFGILDGLRTFDEQRKNVAAGKSWTLQSRHITGHAIDFGVFVDGKYLNGDTPEEYELYEQVAEAFKVAALKEKVPIIWGGDWKQRDGCHIELDKRKYIA